MILCGSRGEAPAAAEDLPSGWQRWEQHSKRVSVVAASPALCMVSELEPDPHSQGALLQAARTITELQPSTDRQTQSIHTEVEFPFWTRTQRLPVFF